MSAVDAVRVAQTAIVRYVSYTVPFRRGRVTAADDPRSRPETHELLHLEIDRSRHHDMLITSTLFAILQGFYATCFVGSMIRAYTIRR
ncbi:hypothetical protein AXG89_36335 [Burkholderia sp. PAMC 26561]|nr:hypothetical protein AXG89_36335 [Burkholderia sp. PAMC 26561]